MMENIEAILSLASAAVGFATAFFVMLRKFTNSEKVRKYAEASLMVKDKVEEYMKIAEENDLLESGEARKDFVVEKVTTELNERGIEVDESVIEVMIEKFIDLTKRVNRK